MADQAEKGLAAQNALTRIADINKRLAEAKKAGCHILSIHTFQEEPPASRLVIQTVQIDATRVGDKFPSGEVYPQKGGELSLSRVGFDKLADAAGIQWVWEAMSRKDNAANPRYCHFQAVGRIRGMSGTWRTIAADKAIDLDVLDREVYDNLVERAQKMLEGKDPKTAWFRSRFSNLDEAMPWINGQVRANSLQIQKHIMTRCQTGAMGRVVQKALSLKGSYTVEELKKPFVFASLVFSPDMNHPQDRQFMLEQAGGAAASLYGARPSSGTDRLSALSYPETVLEGQMIEVYDAGKPGSPVAPEPASVKQSEPPPEEPSATENARMDFLNCDVHDQTLILKQLMSKKHYTKTLRGAIEEWSNNQRIAFYEHLIVMPDDPGARDLPFD